MRLKIPDDPRRCSATPGKPGSPAFARGQLLQQMMRHESYTTTERYINVARQIKQNVLSLYVPPVLAKVGQTG